jgi:ketosteroid isomerase-like protein
MVLACEATPSADSAPEAGAALDTAGVDSAAVDAAVRALLDEQVAGWNRGDLEDFMAGYWQSDTLRFASGGDVTFGWGATLDRYRTRYPDRATMGTLSFVDVVVEPLGNTHALAFGRYVLEREADRPTGLFTLLLERRPEGWRIVHDHTSAGDSAED